MKDKIISSSLRLGIHERYLGMQKNWRSEAFGFERFESTGRASEEEGLSLENLGESLRRCRCMHFEESASDGGG